MYQFVFDPPRTTYYVENYSLRISM